MVETSETDPSAAVEAPRTEPPTSARLYVSPIRGGLIVLLFAAMGAGIFALPLLQAVSQGGASATPSAAFIALVLLFFGGFVLFPAVQFARLIIGSLPFVIADEAIVSRARLGFGQTSIEWQNVGEIAIKGVWIILVDGRIKQGRFRRSMVGTRGLWIPALAVHGGGSTVINFIQAFRPDLIEPLVAKVASGRAGRGQ